NELRRGGRVRYDVDGSIGFKALRLQDATVPANTVGDAEGYGANAALSRDWDEGRLYARARAQAGFVAHPSASVMPDVAVSLAGWLDAWGVGGEVAFGPAYPGLLTLASLVPST